MTPRSHSRTVGRPLAGVLGEGSRGLGERKNAPSDSLRSLRAYQKLFIGRAGSAPS